MNISILEREYLATEISFSDDALSVNLNDGRSITVPLVWFPRLLTGTKDERAQYELIGNGEGIHWPRLDEDISVNSLLSGKPSHESQSSIAKWLQKRQA